MHPHIADARDVGNSEVCSNQLVVGCCRSIQAAQTLVSGIRSRRIKPYIDCFTDSTLPESLGGQKIFFASNLHNNEDLLPHYILQLLQLIVRLPVGSSYVSIYESGSTDETGDVLHVCAAHSSASNSPT